MAPDNLLIQGENLHALRELHGQVKNVRLIYIDPPYNTGSADYLYADAMPREQWLRFMVERLEAARTLLIDDAVVAIQCSFHQSAHLEVTLDGLDWLHKVMVFHVLVRHPDRALTADKQFNDVMEQILIYSPDPRFRMPRREKERDLTDYRWEVALDGPGSPALFGGRECRLYPPEQWRKVETAPGEGTFRTHSIRGSLREKNSSGRFWVAHLEALDLPALTLIQVPGIGDDGLGHRFFHSPKAGNRNGSYFQGVPQSSTVTRLPYPNFLDFHAEFNQVAGEGGVSFRNGKKPEALLRLLMEMFTAPGDLVLDYHLGSGTTAAVALKLGRRFIGIEREDFAETVALARLQAVVAGEQSGISSEVGWSGGGAVTFRKI
ncbi:MAG: site-specific DNA-methyltransferase [Corynebacterium sp.]|uniref:DNA methyltransferase n=1 Tax=Corynebacterium sp. TaxID=1720 RepID=UPI0026DF38E8|nr:site-specific DNA-methyltransferase [Corynebacterium sp.]MDO5670472.1 site-specific DNA-methyltransferase [Corynebacterium sp.]